MQHYLFSSTFACIALLAHISMSKRHVAAKRLQWVQSAILLSTAAADIWVSHAECLLCAVLNDGLKAQRCTSVAFNCM